MVWDGDIGYVVRGLGSLGRENRVGRKGSELGSWELWVYRLVELVVQVIGRVGRDWRLLEGKLGYRIWGRVWNWVQSRERRGRKRTIAHTVEVWVGEGRDRPIALLAVPAGPVGHCSGRWARGGQLEVVGEVGAAGMHPVRGRISPPGQELDVPAHVEDGGLNPRTPLVEDRSRVLQRRHAVIPLIPHLRELEQLQIIHLLLELGDAVGDPAIPLLRGHCGLGVCCAVVL